MKIREHVTLENIIEKLIERRVRIEKLEDDNEKLRYDNARLRERLDALLRHRCYDVAIP